MFTDNDDTFDDSLNPTFSIDPTQDVRGIINLSRQVYPETTSPLLTPTSVSYTPPGSVLPSLAPQPGQQPNLAPPNPVAVSQPVQVAQAAPSGVAPPLRQPTPTPGQNVPAAAVINPFEAAGQYDPNAALQNKRNQLVKDAERARAQGTGWFRQLMDDEGAEKSREDFKRMEGEIAEIDKQIQTQSTNQQLAKNSGLFQAMPATADATAIAAAQLDEWKNLGNIGAYRGLLATGHAQQASIYNAEGFNKLGKDVVSAEKAFGYLDAAKSSNDYDVQRAKAMKEAASNKNARSFGLTEDNIPKSLEEYKARRTLIQSQKNDAAELVSTHIQSQENRGVPQVITDEKVAKPIIEQFQLGSGDVMPNTKAVKLPDMGNQIGAMAQPGSKDIGAWGDQNGKPGKVHDMNSQKYKEVTEMLAQPEYKGAINKYKSANDFYKTVMHDANWEGGPGVAMVYDKLGGVFRNVAEAAQGAGTIGFTRQLELKFGTVDNALNQLYTNASALKAWLQSGQKGEMPTPEPRLTPQAIKGFRDAAKFELDLTREQLTRLEGPIGFLGQNGGSLGRIGLDKEAQELLQPLLNEATQQARLDKDKYPAVIRGTSRVYLPEGTKGKDVIPPGSYAESINAINNNVTPPAAPNPFTGGAAAVPFAPGAPPAAAPPVRVIPGPTGGPALRPLAATPAASLIQSMAPQPAPAAPVQQAQAQLPASWGVGVGAAPPPVAQPSAPGGGGGAVRTAPPTAQGGYDPATFNAGLMKGESGGRNLPPNASGASGYHQIIRETWNRVKPPGAPDEAYKATREQQDQARDNYVKENANALKSANIPVNNLTLAIAHNLGAGAGGAKTLLNAPDSDIALNHVNRKSAAANPQFFWDKDGKQMTVAESKAKYAEFYRAGGAETRGTGAMPYPNAQTDKEHAANRAAGFGLTDTQRAKNVREAKVSAAQAAPAVLGTLGAVGGAVSPIPGGAAMGGALGGGIGGAIEHYVTGPPEAQNPAGFVMPVATGAAKGGVAALPGAGPAGIGARVVGSGLVYGGDTALKGGSVQEIAANTGGAMLGAMGGEAVGAAFSGALGPTFSKIYNAFTKSDQQAVRDAGKVIAEQKPKNMLADGSTVENKAYTAAEKELENRGIDAEHAAHAYNTSIKKPTTTGEAFATRPGQKARMQAGQELEDIKNLVGATGANIGVGPRNPVPSPTLTPSKGGVLEALQTPQNPSGTLGHQYRPEILQAEMKVQTTANNMGERFGNMADARTLLLEHEATAIAAGDVGKQKAMREAADIIRGQQETLINRMLPPDQAQPLIDHLRAASERYRNAMLAGGKDIVATIAKGGAAGNEAKVAFDRVAGKDNVAKRWVNSLVDAHSSTGRQKGDLLYVVATGAGALASLAVIPVVGPVIGTAAAGALGVITYAKAKQALQTYMTQKASGKMANFKDLVSKEMVSPMQVSRQSGAALGAGGGAMVGQQATQPAAPAP